MVKLEHKLIKMKIGILGSSFNPPHIGHLKISKKAIKDFGLDQVWWLITKKNPLKKKPILNLKVRIDLSEQVTKNEK